MMHSDRGNNLSQRLSTYLRQKNLSTFAFPPATEEQLHMTEDLLEISLPPLLQVLYMQIANGGFGPKGMNIFGALGGFRHETVEQLLTTQNAHGCSSFVDIRHVEEREGNPRVLFFVPEVHPKQMFLLYADSSSELYLHCETSRVYLATDDFNGGVDVSGEWIEGMTWFCLRDSLAAWLVSWMQGETLSMWLDELGALLLGK